MQVSPNSTIVLLKNVPLDSDYEHTFYFATRLQQETYFYSKKATYPNGNYMDLQYQSYVRVSGGKIRVSGVADWYFSCNYMMFKNANYLNKWFYAFIQKINYVNDNTTEIEFEIDVMQTWLFDYNLEDCMVEREHTATDVLFDQQVPEKLGLGDSYFYSRATPKIWNSSTGYYEAADLDCKPSNYILLTKRIVYIDPTTQEIVIEKTDGGYLGNIYTPLNVRMFNSLSALRATVKGYVDNGYEDDIVDIYCYPYFLGTIYNPSIDTETPIQKDVKIDLPTSGGDYMMACGYVPRNKKLLQYPYNFLTVSNNNGNVAEYHWEDWLINLSLQYVGEFVLTGTFAPVATAMLYPTYYRGLIQNDYDSGISIVTFPKIAFQGDIYAAWQAQHSSQRATADAMALLGVGLQTAVGIEQFSTGDPSGFGTIGQAWVQGFSHQLIADAQVKDMKKVPPQLHGQIGGEGLTAHLQRYRFDCYYTSVKSRQAQMLDEYFDKFGYAVNRLKKPNRNVRPYWTYCKTVDCAISGELPPDDAKAISSIYNKGVTWWNLASPNTDEIVGNYSLDNTVS